MGQQHARRVIPSLVVIAGLLGWQSADAIITRHDLSDDDYVVEDSEYPAVVDLFQPGDCTGTLIQESFLLTAAHCAEDMNPSQTLEVDGVSYDVAEIILHPEWGGWLYDIALVRFDTPVTGVSPYPLYRETDEQGQMITLVGRGLHATGLEGEAGASMDRQLRRATNIVTEATPHWLEVYFEAPGENGITDLEGVGAAGDSGGPAFIETDDGIYLAGLNSWGDAFPYSDLGKYGGWDYSTRVSSYLDWIDSVAGTSPEDDPGTNTTPGTSTTTTPTDTTPTGTNGEADPVELEAAGTCGCASTDAGWTTGWLGALALLGIRRRRTPSNR